MDINRTRLFLLSDAEDLDTTSRRLVWDPRREALTLAQDQALRLPNLAPAQALAAWADAPALVRDPFRQVGRIAPDGARLEYNAGQGYLPLQDGELRDVAAPLGRFVDLSIGGSGRLAALYADTTGQKGVLVFDLDARWQVSTELGHAVVRAVIDGEDRVWCVGDARLSLCSGQPLPHPYPPLAERFEPVAVNPEPFRVVGGSDLPAGLHVLAACADGERLCVLVHDDAHAQQILALRLEGGVTGSLRAYALEEDIPFVTDLAVLPGGRLAALAPKEPDDEGFVRRDCPVLSLEWDAESATGTARLVHERYSQLSQAQPRFIGALDGTVRYLAVDGPRELHPAPYRCYPSTARATLRYRGSWEMDSEAPGNVWHRLYLDACIPTGTSLAVWAKAYDDPEQADAAGYERQPAPLWNPQPSELPYYHGKAPFEPGTSGLFEILLQRGRGAVRELRGRYLKLRLVMTSDGRHTPALHALRIYYPRFSYQRAYLPEHFHQQEEYSDEDRPANGADVRERFLAAFEGMLTPIEGRVAAAECLVHPGTMPVAQLSRMAEVLGMELPDQWPEARARRLIANAGRLQRRHGSYEGLCLVLDIATDGAVRRGQVVVVENFRLRRTMATLLGIEMDDRDHPLTLGTGMSGNSIVGESLILSEEDARTFLALFAPELATESEAETVKAFFDRYSHQVTVLLHGSAADQAPVVEQTLKAHMPAHLQWRIMETDHPFVLGLAPLLGVDTFLEPMPPPRRVTLEESYLGQGDLLKNPLALSPKDVNAIPRPSP